CGVVVAIIWLVVHRGHRLVAKDLIPLVGFALSGLVSLGLVAISTASAPPRHRTQPMGTIPPRPGPSPTAGRTYRAPTPRTPAVPVHRPAAATPTRAPVANTHRSATATPTRAPAAITHRSAA